MGDAELKKVDENNLEYNLMEIRLVVLRCIAEVWKSDTVTIPPTYELPPAPQQSGFKYKQNPTGESIKIALDKTAVIVDTGDYSIIQKIDITFIDLIADVIAKFQSGDVFATDIKYLVTVLVELKLLRIFLEQCDPYALNAVFGSVFGYSLPYVNFGIQIIKPTAVWNYYGDHQWTKPKTEALYIALPKQPPKHNDNDTHNDQFKAQYETACRLMEYYKNFPDFFGPQSYVGGASGGTSKININPQTNDSFPPPTGPVISEESHSSSGNDYDLGVAEDAFLSFSAVLTKIIAVIWHNAMLGNTLDYPMRLKNQTKVLKKFQKKHPNGVKSIYDFSLYLNSLEGDNRTPLIEFNNAYDRDLVTILKEHFSYVSPWIFKIRFIMVDPDVFWTKDNNKYTFNVKDIVNLTSIEVPNAPTGHETSNVSMALARYNATGPAYPFTCS